MMSNHHQAPKPTKTIYSFFKPSQIDKSKCDGASSSNVASTTPNEDVQCPSSVQAIEHKEVNEQHPSKEKRDKREEVEDELRPSKTQRVKPGVSNVASLERDPGLRIQICEYPINERDDVRRAYIRMGPYQPSLKKYPGTKSGNQFRRFKKKWFKKFPWLEYSPSKDSVYCFPCFLFEKGSSKFTIDGFKSWKRVNDAKRCSLLQHVGGPNSVHMRVVGCCEDLKRPSQHITKVLNTQSKDEILKNRLRLETTIENARWLALQGLAFRGHDESIESENCGNFLELLKFLAKMNDKVKEVVLENAPKNDMYTSPKIQKEVLNILVEKVRIKIREEVGDAKFCILVDEVQDSATKEQMAIVLRFVDNDGFVRERFFKVVGVEDTNAATLKKEISIVLARYDLHICNMRGQGYDGASNMRGAWNGLQALFLRECPSAYYVHCFAHRLQLALVAAAKDKQECWLFFSMLSSVVNLVVASPKRQGELHVAQENEIVELLATGELETGKGANQIGNLQRAGATRWSSHFSLVSSLIDMFGPTCTVIQNIIEKGSTNSMRGEAKGVHVAMMKFEFVFILHILHETMGITDMLCQSLQQKMQDIINAMRLVATTTTLLQRFRDHGWDNFLEGVVSFCKKHKIDMPDMSSPHRKGTSRSCQQHDCITVGHHFRIDIFTDIVDFQLMELKTRFTKDTIELLILSSSLEPRDAFKSFDIDNICSLASKFYSQDFTKHELGILRCQLQHYQIDVLVHPHFHNMSTISELCRGLVETRKAEHYTLIDRMIRLVLTLPVSTATTERAFSSMKIMKTQLRNKMEDEFLADCMVIFIERKFAKKIDLSSIMEEFDARKDRRVKFQ